MMRSIRFMSSEDLGYARFWPPVPVNGLNKGVVKVEIRPACNEPLPRNSQKPLGFPFDQLTPDSAPDPQPARSDKPLYMIVSRVLVASDHRQLVRLYLLLAHRLY